MTRLGDASHQTARLLPHPAQHEERGGGVVVRQKTQDLFNLEFQSLRELRPAIWLHAAPHGGFDLEVLLHVEAENR